MPGVPRPLSPESRPPRNGVSLEAIRFPLIKREKWACTGRRRAAHVWNLRPKTTETDLDS